MESSIVRFVLEEDCLFCGVENERQLGRTEAERELMYMMEEMMKA